MHHTKEFTKYSFQKKTQLVIALVFKAVILGTAFTGLFFLLKNYMSPVLSFVFLHIILLSCILIFLYIHKQKKFVSHNHGPNTK